MLPYVAKPGEMDRVSIKGYIFGYTGGGILLAIDIAMIELMSDKLLATRLVSHRIYLVGRLYYPAHS
ncbi:MAG: hypothetical protein R3B51_11605 [Thermodesulfobacteriota bacterium]